MESTDRELLLQALPSHTQLRRLYEEHQRIEEQLTLLERRGFLTAQEERQCKALKAKKLRGVDRMMELLSEFRQSASA